MMAKKLSLKIIFPFYILLSLSDEDRKLYQKNERVFYSWKKRYIFLSLKDAKSSLSSSSSPKITIIVFLSSNRH